MNTHKIYTRRTLGLDNKVWLVMFITIILSLGLLSYRLIEKKECMPVEFTIKLFSGENRDTIYTVGETLFFNSSTQATDITWDFDDKSEKSYGKNAYHKFQTEGIYNITVTTGAGCEKTGR